jgi:hypothetical protein
MCVDAAPCKKKTMADFDYIKFDIICTRPKDFVLDWLQAPWHEILAEDDWSHMQRPKGWKQSGALSDWPKVPILNDLLLLTVLCLSWQAECQVWL